MVAGGLACLKKQFLPGKRKLGLVYHWTYVVRKRFVSEFRKRLPFDVHRKKMMRRDISLLDTCRNSTAAKNDCVAKAADNRTSFCDVRYHVSSNVAYEAGHWLPWGLRATADGHGCTSSSDSTERRTEASKMPIEFNPECSLYRKPNNGGPSPAVTSQYSTLPTIRCSVGNRDNSRREVRNIG